MDSTLTFHWRESALSGRQQGKAAAFAVLALCMLIACWLASQIPWSSLNWQAAWRKLSQHPGQALLPLAYSGLFVSVLVMRYLHKKRARLVLDGQSLQYRCGLPFLKGWLDWNIDLNAMRSGEIAFRLLTHPSPVYSLQMYLVGWGDRGISSQKLRPCNWYLPEQAFVRVPTPFFNLVVRLTPKYLANLQARLDALPLVHALALRGIHLPPVATQSATAKAGAAGLDLMDFARLRIAVILFFVLLLLAVGLMLSVRDSYYFATPPWLTWLCCAAVAGMCMLVWLWKEGPSNTLSDTLQPQGKGAPAAPQKGFRATQTMVAALIGVAAGLCAPSLPLVYSNLVQAPRSQVFELQKESLQLVVPNQTLGQAMPPIDAAERAVEYWKSLPQGESVSLPIRRGPWGLWWQYDATNIREKWIAYYDQHP